MNFVKCVLFALVISTFTLISGQASAKEINLTNPEKWQSPINSNHKLVGKIWSKEADDFITPKDLAKKLLEKRFILLGEIHDNPDHHWLQAQIIHHLATRKIKPALTIEMIKVDQMRRLNSYRSQPNSKAKYLGTALQWKQHGWPDWNIYLPIGEQIFKHNLEVFPGHTTRMMIDHLIKSNMSIIPEKAIQTFKLDVPLSLPLNKALSQDIRISHCNRLPEDVIPPMARVQRFRDAWMADVMLQAATDDKGQNRQVILIAGTGHTRTDRGVPWYLEKRQNQVQDQGPNSTLSIQFAEATNKSNTIKDLIHKGPDGHPAADFIWVTPTIKRGDPCQNIPDFGRKN